MKICILFQVRKETSFERAEHNVLSVTKPSLARLVALRALQSYRGGGYLIIFVLVFAFAAQIVLTHTRN